VTELILEELKNEIRRIIGSPERLLASGMKLISWNITKQNTFAKYEFPEKVSDTIYGMSAIVNLYRATHPNPRIVIVKFAPLKKRAEKREYKNKKLRYVKKAKAQHKLDYKSSCDSNPTVQPNLSNADSQSENALEKSYVSGGYCEGEYENEILPDKFNDANSTKGNEEIMYKCETKKEEKQENVIYNNIGDINFDGEKIIKTGESTAGTENNNTKLENEIKANKEKDRKGKAKKGGKII